MMMKKWDERFLDLASLVCSWSKDPSTKVGAVIVDHNNRLISVGYNGLPKGIDDRVDRLSIRDLKLKMIIHAERNAILFARRDLTACTIYTTPFMPCAACASIIIQSGIARVVAPNLLVEAWQEEMDLAKELFQEARVKLQLY